MEGSKISEYKGVLLTTTNFVVWEREIRDFLEENDLIDLVISSDREKNRKKGLEGPGRVALTRLKASLSPDIKETVRELNHDTPQELWDFLKKEFGWLSLEERLLKLGEAAQVKLAGFDTIYGYLNHIDTIVRQVGGEDFLVPKWMHVTWYLMGLPAEYQPVVSEIRKLKEEQKDPCNVRQLITSFYQEELSKAHATTPPVDSSAARATFMKRLEKKKTSTSHQATTNPGETNRPFIQGFYKWIRGLTNEERQFYDCQLKDWAKRPDSPQLCGVCKGGNHWLWNCQKLRGLTIQRWRPGASVNSGFVSDSDDIKDIEKYVDNGTNYSMCPLRQEFGNLDPVSGAVVVLADNQMVKVDARGAWHIPTACGHPFIEHNSLFVPTLGKALFSPN